METVAVPVIDTQVLVILCGIFGAMFATLTTLIFTFIRIHHRDNIETRELFTEAIEKLTGDFDKRLDKQDAKFDKRFDKQDAKFDAVIASLSDARERLARIEGQLGFDPPAETDPESSGGIGEADASGEVSDAA
ncbi:MAG: hypothetical protein OXD50_06945 [Chloroflexi bacterium]|nr:LrgB family protein [Acidimicrobiia bacterium]MCY4618275.1 hypothetical protein [Chloroflexota bacterium]